MLFIYNLIVQIANFSLKIIAQFSPKIKLFIDGRKPVFEILKSKIQANDQTIWFHAASLGEYEQGLPVIEKQKKNFRIIKSWSLFSRLQAMKFEKTTTLPMLRFTYLWIPKKMHANF